MSIESSCRCCYQSFASPTFFFVHQPTSQSGFSFSTPYLHNGVMFAGRSNHTTCVENLDVSTEGCEGVKICVLDGTTHRAVVEELIPTASIVIAPTFDAFRQIFQDGGCTVLAGEQVEIGMQQQEKFGEDYVLGSKTHSKEPIAIVTRNNDPQWSDFCNWILQALFSAEEVRGSGSKTSLSDLPVAPFFGDEFAYM